MIPLLGQGKPLPSDCPYAGEWLHENKLFLYLSTSQQLKTAEFTAGFRRPDSEWCLGFNAATLASLLGVGIDELFKHNRARTLILESVGPMPPRSGGTVAKEYTFRIDNRTASLTVEAGPLGTA